MKQSLLMGISSSTIVSVAMLFVPSAGPNPGAHANPQTPSATAQTTQGPVFDETNPFAQPSPLPFHAPPFDKIKDTDYQPAIEAGITQSSQ